MDLIAKLFAMWKAGELQVGGVTVQKGWWRSARLWMAVATALVVVCNDALGMGLSEKSVLELVGLAVAFILGKSYEDANKRSAAMMTFPKASEGPLERP